MQCAANDLSTDRLTHPFNLCSNAGSTHMSYFQRQPLNMTLSMCTQLLWSTMARPVLSGNCPVKPLHGPGHHAAAQFQGVGNLHNHTWDLLTLIRVVWHHHLGGMANCAQFGHFQWFRHWWLCVELFWGVVPWKDIIKYLQKCEGCTHFCEILYVVKTFEDIIIGIKCIIYKRIYWKRWR